MSSVPLQPGARLPAGALLSERFRVVRLVARGGMGHVYEAEDLKLKERVALKILLPDLAEDPRFTERFLREVHLARQVTHPNVCRLYDVFHHRGHPFEDGAEITFLVMELLPGPTLAQRAKEGPTALVDAFDIVRQLAAGLQAAHDAGVVHRDFKSANVVLVPKADGTTRAVITDFGVARSLVEREDELTDHGEVVGTAAYIAPEQLEGGEVSFASDLYSLGVVMYEMVTGRRPFETPTRLTITARRAKEGLLATNVALDRLDPRWEAVILRCLARDPKDRFASADEVSKALEQPAPPPPTPRRAGTVALAVAAAAGVAIAITIAIGIAALKLRSAASRGDVRAIQLTSSSGLDLNGAFSPGGKRVAYASDRTGSFEIRVTPRVPGEPETVLTSDGAQSVQPVFSPDGRFVAYHSLSRGGIWIRPATGGDARRLVPFGSHPAWSPDGRTIAFQSEGVVDLAPTGLGPLAPSTIWEATVEDGATRARTQPGVPRGGHGNPVYAPDGRSIAFVAFTPERGQVWRVAVAGGAPETLVARDQYDYDPVYSPDGRFLYYGAVTGEASYGLYRLRLDEAGRTTGAPEQVVTPGPAILRHLSLAVDGDALSYSALTTTSNLFAISLSPATFEPTGSPAPLSAENARTSRPVFSPDGARLAFSRWRPGTNLQVWVMNADGTAPAQATSFKAENHSPSWFPDGRRIAYSSDRGEKPGLWAVDLATTAEALVLPLPRDGDSPRLSPDGRSVAFNAHDDRNVVNVFVASVAGGAPKPVTVESELAAFPTWSPDGKLLAFQLRRGEDRQIATVPASGGDVSVVTTAHGQSWSWGFSPDGERIAFAGRRDGVWNVYWISRTTRQEIPLTRYTALNTYVRYPDWSPRGDRIVYELAETKGNVWVLSGLNKR
ncbi:MAG TPA: protein kinase [Thermoanaerobaculia bacterium]|nr:protein kinase [Thermoanaerobaculia bacterium]